MEAIATVAKGLKELNEKVIYVGGAVVSMYATDGEADIVRPTSDIDITVSAANVSEQVALEERLRALGFNPDPYSTNICRYLYKGIAVDIIPLEDSIIGPSNPWYKVGSSDIREAECAGVKIRLLPVAAFLATKFEAFNDRGRDHRTSHDFEDIIYVLDNHLEVVSEILNSDTEILDFIKQELRKLIDHANSEEILSAHLHPVQQVDRLPIIKKRIQEILKE